MDHFVIFASCLSRFLDSVCSLQPCGHLQEKGLPLDSLECDALLCFCHFQVWCLGSGVVLDCIDSLLTLNTSLQMYPYTPKESSNAYAFVLAFSSNLKILWNTLEGCFTVMHGYF